MSKAFTKDTDDAPAAPRRALGVPVPVPNFVTADGMRAARAELDRLAKAGDHPDRARELTAHLETAQVAPPGEPGSVGFGAWVTVERDSGARATYRLVGAIEADVRRGWLSWQSPVASALWHARVGDTVELPRGEEVTVVEIRYGSRSP
ncbi:MAG: GreA/GreB family elongation factor [Acidobacteriota bacterium]